MTDPQESVTLVLPNFFVVGSAKCGTTSLAAALGEHPEVFFSEPKEPNFFAFDRDYQQGLEAYAPLFEAGRGFKARGEGSVVYSHPAQQDIVMPRLLDAVPDAKLIYIVRDPLARMESTFRELTTNGFNHEDEAQRWKGIPRTLDAALDAAPDEMIGETRYFERLQSFLKYVPRERILIIFLQDFKNHPEGVLATCFDFLGVNPSSGRSEKPEQKNSGEEKVRDTALMHFVRNYAPAVLSIVRKVPGARALLRRFARQQADASEGWSVEGRTRALAAVRDDAERLLEACHKPRDYWALK
ncbi:MAG: sulfotransferase family protein [Hyphomonas sp.]